jgi:hypothetical protein
MSLSKDFRVSTVTLYNSVKAVVPMESNGSSNYMVSKKMSRGEIPSAIMAYFMVQAGYTRDEIMMELSITNKPMMTIEKFLKKHIEQNDKNLNRKIQLVRNHLKLNYQISI